MLVKNLIKVYEANFGWKYRIKETFERSKLMFLPVLILVASGIVFFIVTILNNDVIRVIFIPISVISFIGSVVWGTRIQEKTMITKYGSLEKYEKNKLDKVKQSIDNELGLIGNGDNKHYELVDKLVHKEIDEINESLSFPFINTIRQLVIAVLITGLLSYSFNQLRDGNSEVAFSLLTIYLVIIGFLFILGSIVSNYREFTKRYKLKQISKILIQVQLKVSLSENKQ